MRLLLMTFVLIFGLVLAFVLLNENVGDIIDGPIPEATPVDDSTSTAVTEPTPVQVSEIDASADRDPREILVELAQDPDLPNLELVYRYLPERFRILEFDEDWVGLLAPIRRPTFPDSVDELEIEEYPGYTLVRSASDWLSTWVFVEENGEWRLDPGDRSLLMASAQLQQDSDEGFYFGMASPDDYQARSQNDIENGSVSPLIRGRLQGVGVFNSYIDISMVWEHELGSRGPNEEPVDSHLLEDVVIPLESVSWEAGDASGGVEILWTDAALSDTELRLPGWPSETMADEASESSETYVMEPYGSTLRLLDVPAGIDQITLRFERIEVGPFGHDSPVPPGEVVTYMFEFVIPVRTTDPVMIGEAPESDDSGVPVSR
jgi:hypothetical protein